MSFFQTDAAFYQSQGVSARDIPGPGASLVRGILGGVLMSLAGFAPWALLGKFIAPHLGEAGLYLVCALAFIVTSGLLLHRLLAGPRSLPRFYKLFGVSFLAYSVAWIAGWLALRGHPGSWSGLAAGALAMATITAGAFGTWRLLPLLFLFLFLPVAGGYFLGGVVEGKLMASATSLLGRQMAMMSWGLFFGIGFGTALGLAYHFSQRAVIRH